jgi:hypothetical protein
VADTVMTEIRDLLAEIRDLLLPVADAHRDEYVRRQAEREAQRIKAIRELLLNPKRAKAWNLSDGSRTQREIAKQVGLDEASASRFFKSLRALRAISDSTSPQRITEVKPDGQ